MTEEDREVYYYKRQQRLQARQASLGPEDITVHFQLYMRAVCEGIPPNSVCLLRNKVNVAIIPPIASELWKWVNGKYIEDEYQKSIDFQTRHLANHGLDEESHLPVQYSSKYLSVSRDHAQIIDKPRRGGKKLIHTMCFVAW